MRVLLVTTVVLAAATTLSGCKKSAPAEPSAKGTSEAIESAAAAPAPSAKPEAAKCPEGAKCDGYCAPEQTQVANGAECAQCISKECEKPVYQGCSKSSDPKTCEAILECFYRSNCLTGGVTACYCGDAYIDTCNAKGPSNGKCTAVMESGFPNKAKGMSPHAIIKAFGDPETPGGFATAIGLCIANFCAKQCVPYCASKS